MCCVGGCDKRLSERLGKMLCERLSERKGPNFLQVYFSMIQESLNSLQLPSPDEGPFFYC